MTRCATYSLGPPPTFASVGSAIHDDAPFRDDVLDEAIECVRTEPVLPGEPPAELFAAMRTIERNEGHGYILDDGRHK